MTGATALTDSVLSGHPDSKLGGSVMAALNIKNIPTGPGDDIKVDATWAKGDTKNVIETSAASPTSSCWVAFRQQFGSAAASASVRLPTAPTCRSLTGGDGSIHLTTAYGMRGAFNHNWDPYWSSSLFGGIGWVRYDGTSQANYCADYLRLPFLARTA